MTDHTILWGYHPDELTHELSPPTEQRAWATYRELIATKYAALVIDGEVVAHNFLKGPVVATSNEVKG